MRILQIIQRPQLRGAEIFACQLAVELQANRHQVDIMVLFDEDSPRLPFDLTFLYLKGNEKNRWWDIGAYKRLSNIIREKEYDIVQANAGDTLKYASLSKFLFGWKAKLVFRNANKMGDFLNSSFKARINSWLVKQVDFVASVSNECKTDFESVFGFDKQMVEALPIGVGSVEKAVENPLLELGIDPNAPVLLSVAGFVKEKNHAGMLRIFQSLLQQYPKAQLVLVGKGKLQQEIAQQVADLSLNKSVFFLGQRKDVPAIMQHSSMLVMPSLIEGLPGVILEAFSNKLPVIAYNVGGISEIVLNRKTGWLIKKNAEQDFVNAMVEVLQLQADKLHAIKQNALQLVQQEYDNGVIAKRFEAAYERLLPLHSTNHTLINAR